ncbi:UNVERIFIED_CONTAM: hypothetical protein PYX00_011106 [Menopon gallinae]|uniref:Pyruvate kinase n=1 Tax=Menopon gallinae TaxID=328185 RepID=A0AAW2H5Y3_9NEOP
MKRRVKIIATIGPATRSFEKLEALFLEGANVFRLNFSHSTYEEHEQAFYNIKKLESKYDLPIAILADLQGPKLRVGKFKNDKTLLETGQKFRLDLNKDLGDSTRVELPHPQIFEALNKGSVLLVDDGKIKLRVEAFGKDFAETIVEVGGEISNSKGVNFPSGILKLSPLTPKDLKDLDFALSLGVDYIGLSFIQLPENLVQAKEIIKNRAKIISKIEKPSAVDNIEEIIKHSDAIMVARGDLGVEIPTEEVPIVQKRIIKLCRQLGKPVIVATQMLDSMINNPTPTRAEASDVANAVYDGADAVMLSGETTIGKYPNEAVSVMDHIIIKVEKDLNYWERLENDYPQFNFPFNVSEATSVSVGYISEIVNAKYIVAFTTHGTTVNRVCRERSKSMCIGITSSERLYYQMSLNWGVRPLLVDPIKTFSEVVTLAKDWLIKNNLVEKGDIIIVVAGSPVGVAGVTNTIRVVEI